MNQNIETPSLLDVARKLYAEHSAKMTHRQIAIEMDQSKEWVRQFCAGDIKNPGILTLESFIKAVRKLANV